MRSVRSRMLWLAGAEFALAIAAVHLATFARFGGDLPDEAQGALHWLLAAVFAGAVVVAMTTMGLYQVRQRLTVEGVLARLLIGLALAPVALALIYYIEPAFAIWRGWLLLSLVITLLLLGAARVGFARVVDQDAFRRRVVVYGAGSRAAKLLQLRRRSDQRGFQIIAFLPVPNETQVIQDDRVDHTPGDVGALARKHDAEEIVLAMDDRRQGFPIKELLDCKFSGMDVVDVLTFLERESGKINVDLLNPSWLIFAEGFTRRSSRVVSSRTFDLAVSV